LDLALAENNGGSAIIANVHSPGEMRLAND
jgi:hypothetical protein